MQTESQCRFCAKLPVVHHLRSGMPTRCPLCKGQLIEDRGAGTTYRYEDRPEGPPQGKSLGRRLAALLGISATVALVWLLIKPLAPQAIFAAEASPVAQAGEPGQTDKAGNKFLAATNQRTKSTESQLRTELAQIPEVGLVPNRTSLRELERPSSRPDHAAYLADLQRLHPGVRGLPFLMKNCQMPTKEAELLDTMVKEFRTVLDQIIVRDADSGNDRRRGRLAGNQALVERFNQFEPGFEKPKAPENVNRQPLPAGAVAPLQQLMMDQDKQARRTLISLLREIDDRTATAALARRALFDLDPENRDQAVQSLKDRAADDYTPILLEGLRYPWPAVAHNAAAALVQLKRDDVVPQLIAALNRPDPDVPFLEEGVPKVRELVRVNHHRNCVLCHAPSTAQDDPVRGGVPSSSLPLPDPFSVEYYSSSSFERFARADVTYLRQDFSVSMKVADPGKWRATQRFDFLVRVRELTKEEFATLQSRQRPEISEYQAAIIFALNELGRSWNPRFPRS